MKSNEKGVTGDGSLYSTVVQYFPVLRRAKQRPVGPTLYDDDWVGFVLIFESEGLNSYKTLPFPPTALVSFIHNVQYTVVYYVLQQYTKLLQVLWKYRYAYSTQYMCAPTFSPPETCCSGVLYCTADGSQVIVLLCILLYAALNFKTLYPIQYVGMW